MNFLYGRRRNNLTSEIETSMKSFGRSHPHTLHLQFQLAQLLLDSKNHWFTGDQTQEALRLQKTRLYLG